MIDRAARDRLVSAVEAHLERRTSYGALLRETRPGTQDPGVAAVRAHLARLFASVDGPGLSDDLRRNVERCLAFLRSDHPYEWPPYARGPFDRVAGLFGLDPARRRYARWLRAVEAAGDLDAWPFLRRADLERDGP